MADINEIISKEAINDVIRLIGNFDTLETKITSINKTVSSYTEKQKQLNIVTNEADKITKEETKTLEALDKQRQRAYQAMAKEEAKQNELNKAHSNSIAAMGRQNKEMNALRKNLDVNSKEYQQLSQKIAANTVKLKEHDKEIGRSQLNVGNYASTLKGLGTKLLGLGAAFMAGIGAIQMFKGIINSTDAASDFFREQLEGLKQGAEFLGRAIVNLDFSNLINGFKAAFEEGKRYAETLDEIENRQRSLGIQKLDIEGQIIDLKIIARNRRNDLKDREAAVDKIVELEKKKLDITLETSNKAAENELMNAAQITKVDQEVIRDFVSNYDKYIDRIKEGNDLQATANALVTTYTGRNGVVLRDYSKRDAFLNNLNDSQKEALKLMELDNTLTDEKRDKIAQTLSANLNAFNEEKSGIASLSKLRNSLWNELIKEEKEITKTTEDEAKKREKFLEDEAKRRESFMLDKMPDLAKAETDEALKQMELRDTADKESFSDRMRRIEEEKQAKIDAAKEYVSAAADIGSSLLDFNQFLIDTETKDIEAKKEYELQMAGDSAEEKANIELKYAEQLKKLKTKQAKQDKANALFKAAINTALAVTNMLSSSGPLGFITAAIAAAIGVAQIAIIAARPIPQYAKGTNRAGKGLAIVGEKGRELIFGQDGVSMSPGTASLVNLGRGGQRIISNKETEVLLRMARGADDSHSKAMMDRLHQDNRDLISAVRNKKELHIYEGGRKIREREGNYFRNYHNKKILQ